MNARDEFPPLAEIASQQEEGWLEWFAIGARDALDRIDALTAEVERLRGGVHTERLIHHLAEMEAWVEGRKSSVNWASPELAPIIDAYQAVAHSAAVQAYAALVTPAALSEVSDGV